MALETANDSSIVFRTTKSMEEVVRMNDLFPVSTELFNATGSKANSQLRFNVSYVPCRPGKILIKKVE